MLSINTNLSSLITQRSAKQSTNILNQSIERMTTGYKINSAKDNAANYAIATNMSTKINSLMVAEDNVAQGLDLISTAESTLNILENRVTRLRDLQEQASNGTYGADSLKAINSECNALIDEINRLYETSQYNGINLFLETTTLADGREVVVKESDAELDTTFKDLGVTAREFEVYDSNNNLIQAYDLEEDDTVRDFFAVLQSHGFTTSLGNGEIALSSVDDYHIGGLLADELGISTARQSFISQTEQSGSMEIETTSANVSSTTVYTTTTNEVTQTNTIWTTTTQETTQTNTLYTTTTTSTTQTNTLTDTVTLGSSDTSFSVVTYIDNGYADETTELGSIIEFSGVTKSVYIKDYSGAVIATQGFGASDTVQSFLDFCTTNGVTAVINNGVISFTPTGAYYLEDVDTNGIIEQLGITVDSDVTTTTVGNTVTSSTSIITAYSSATEINWSNAGSGVRRYLFVLDSPENTESGYLAWWEDCEASLISNLRGFGITASYDPSRAGIYITSIAAGKTFSYAEDYVLITESSSSPLGVSYMTQLKVGTRIASSFRFGTYVTTTTKASDMGISEAQYITVVQNGTEKVVTVNSSNTIADMISALSSVGITATLSSTGKMTFKGNSTTYIKGMSDTLATKLKVNGKTCYVENSTTVMTINSSAEQNADFTYSLTGTSTLADLGINTNQVVTVVQNGTEKEVTFNTTDTLNTFITNLAGAGITASVADGKLTVSGSDTAYIKVMSNALQTALNLTGNFSTTSSTITGTETVTLYTTTTTSTTETQTLTVTTTTSTTETLTSLVTTTSSSTQTSTVWITSTVSATGATTFEEAGVNRSFKVTIMSEGTKNVLNITKDTSFADFYNELQARGFNITENVDSITFVGQGDTYLKSNELNNLLKFSALNKTEAERTINTDSDHLTYNEILENVYAPGKVNLQVGLGADSNSQIEVDVSFKLGAVNGLRNIGLDTSTDYLTQIDSVLADIREKQTHFGAVSNRLESALDEISIQYENLVSSRSTIRDADIAEVSSTYIQQQILQQASATLMSTANQSPAIALQLI